MHLFPIAFQRPISSTSSSLFSTYSKSTTSKAKGKKVKKQIKSNQVKEKNKPNQVKAKKQIKSNQVKSKKQIKSNQVKQQIKSTEIKQQNKSTEMKQQNKPTEMKQHPWKEQHPGKGIGMGAKGKDHRCTTPGFTGQWCGNDGITYENKCDLLEIRPPVGIACRGACSVCLPPPPSPPPPPPPPAVTPAPAPAPDEDEDPESFVNIFF
jgi:hypothetical protein